MISKRQGAEKIKAVCSVVRREGENSGKEMEDKVTFESMEKVPAVVCVA